MSNISYRVSNTKLFKERKDLGIDFCWETEKEAVFSRLEDDLYLLENFKTGKISVADVKGTILDKTGRILNLFRLNI